MASKSVLDIIIRTIKEGGADKATVDGLVKVKNAIMGAAQVAGTLAAAYVVVDKVFDATVGTMVAYADQVRTIQNATGATAESASQLIQILDDQKVSFEQLEKVVAKNGKTYDYSIAGIAAMSDEYLKLSNANAKAAFMQERFGKAWIDFVPVMQQGGDAIREQADAVSDGLVLTQSAVDQARQYEIALDNWNDAVLALKVSYGSQFLPTMVTVMQQTNDHARALEIMKEKGLSTYHAMSQVGYPAAMAQAKAEREAATATDSHTAALDENEAAITENAAAVQALSAAHQATLGLITSVANETQSYSAKQAELTANMAANRAEAEKLYPWQKSELADLNAKYDEMTQAYDANAAAHNAAMGKIQYDLFITKLSVDGITDAEFVMAQQAGLMFGVFDQASVTAAGSMNAVAQAVTDGRLRVQDMDAALRMMEKGYTVDVVINTIQQITGGWHATGSSAAQEAGIGGGFAEGGISTGPASGHMELLHGTEAVIPLQNGSIPVQMQGAPAGGSNITINLTYAPGFSTANAAELERNLMPLIKRGVMEARR